MSGPALCKKKRQTEQLETFESVFEQISTEAFLYICEQNAEIKGCVIKIKLLKMFKWL